MFEVGEYIVYGTKGVCKVDQVGTLESFSNDKNRLYYTLIPVFNRESRVYAPVDSEKVIKRPVLSKAEAEELIQEIPQIEQLWVQDEKRREQIYKDAMRTDDCKEWIKIIKTLYLRRQSRLIEGKKVTSVDERYLQIAEDSLYGELSVVLGMEKEKIEGYITKCVEELNE